jgi:hypothetical protein
VNRYEDDFQLLKLLFLSYADERTVNPAAAQERRQAQPGY